MPSAIVDEQCQRLYALYERKSKSFRTALISVVGLMTIVFLLVFYPYVTFRGQRYTLEAELKKFDREMASVEGRLKETAQLIETFHDHQSAAYEKFADFNFRELQDAASEHRRRLAAVRDALGGDPDLRPWLSGEAAGRDLPAGLIAKHSELAPADDDPCFWLSGDTWMKCALARQIGSFHREISDNFAHKHISHLRNDLFVPLYESLSTLHGEFRDWLLGAESAWSIDGEKARGSLRDQYRLWRNAYMERIDMQERVILELKNDTGEKLWGLEKQRKETAEALESVKGRLEEMKNLRDIQTPFGQLPVGLNDLVLLFPVLLAAGFLLVASLLSETLRLRQAYYHLCRLRDPEEKIFDRSHVALVAPVWVDPLQSKLQRALRLAILALPGLIFAISILLLLVNRLLWGAFMEEVRLGPMIYAALYIVSGLLILEGGRRVYSASRVYDVN